LLQDLVSVGRSRRHAVKLQQGAMVLRDVRRIDPARHLHGTQGSERGSSWLEEQPDMSKTTIIAKMRPDCSVVEVLADGSERPLPATAMQPMTPEEVEEAARRPRRAADDVGRDGKGAPRAAHQIRNDFGLTAWLR
jgi:hypothetical protein